MFMIKIGQDECDIARCDDQWVRSRMAYFGTAHHAPCIRFRINLPGIQMALSTGACGAMGGVGRPPNPLEARILRLWEQCEMHDPRLTDRQVWLFKQQLIALVNRS
jgi:hypothetical protein